MSSPFKESLLDTPLPIWKDASLLEEAIVPYIANALIRNEPFVGPSSELVPFEAKRRYKQKEDVLKEVEHPLGYVRVGNLLLLDHRLQQMIPYNIEQRFKENIIWLWNFQSDISNATHLLYAPLPLYALTTLNLEGRNVLDLGSADGVQSLGAHKMGAKKVYSVELNQEHEALYNNHIAANRFPSEKFKFINADIAEPESFLQRLEEPIDVVVANMGPIYGDAHLDAIKLLKNLPTVQTFIAGSYLPGHDVMDSEEAIHLLALHGYSTNFRELRFRRLIQAFIVDKNKESFQTLTRQSLQ